MVLIDRDFLCSTCLIHTLCATAHCVDKTIHSKLQNWYFKKLWLVSYLWNKYFPCDSIFSICITRVLMMTSSNENFFPRYWPFVRIIHRWPVNSPHKGQWRGALVFFCDLRLNKRLSKQWWGWWLETPLWRHCNVCVWPRLMMSYVYAMHSNAYSYWLSPYR